MEGRLRPPASKSLAQRALVAAALAGGRTHLTGLDPSTREAQDVRDALELVRACGARVRRPGPRAATIEGRPPGPGRGWAPEGALRLGESGTLARLATAAAALCGRAPGAIELVASGTLLGRASPALFAALERAGVGVSPAGARGTWPVVVRPVGPPDEVVLERPGSSQEVSALLVALAAWPGTARLRVEGAVPSRPYVELTRSVLARFGVACDVRASGTGELWEVRGPLTPPAAPLGVEADASAALVALVAACLSGGELVVEGVGAGSAQGDAAGVAHLRALGCRAEASDDELRASGPPTRGAELDLGGQPDLAPPLAALAAGAALGLGGPPAESRLAGLGTLRGKESDRLEGLRRALASLGLRAAVEGDGLRIGPPAGRVAAPAGPLSAGGDHRMAFALALLGLLVPGVAVADPACVAKSWPGFWEDLAGRGALPLERGPRGDRT